MAEVQMSNAPVVFTSCEDPLHNMNGWLKAEQLSVYLGVISDSEMRAGLLLVLGCLLLEASLAADTEERKGSKVEDAKEGSREEKKIVAAEDDGVKKNVKKALFKKITYSDEEGIDKKISEGKLEKTNVETFDNGDSLNVSTNANNTRYLNGSINVTTPLNKDLNVSKEYFDKLNCSLENADKDLDLFESEEYFTESATTEYYDSKKFERRSDDFGDETFIEDEIKPTRKTSPKLDKEMVEMAFKEDQTSKIKSLLEEQHDPKKFQRRTFDIMGMLGFKNNHKYDTVVKITKEVAVPVPYTVEKKIPVPVKVEVEHPVPVQIPKSYPVTVEKKVYYPVKEYIRAPYPVYKKVPYLVRIAVEKPVPVHIEKPYPVYIERKVPYPVEKHIHYPVKIPVDRPIPVKIPFVKNVYYPVEKKVVYPVPVPVEKPVAVPVEKPYPVYVEKEVPTPIETHVPFPIPVEEHKIPEETTTHTIEHNEFKDYNFDPSEQIKIDFHNNQYGKSEGGFVPIVQNHDPTKLLDKKDEEVTIKETINNEKTTEKSTLQVENEKIKEDITKNKGKDVQEFGRKIQKSKKS